MRSNCHGICTRFLKNIARWYGRTSTGARRWHGSKVVYDDRVYDYRVMKNVGSGHFADDYRRCTKCDIVLMKDAYDSCPCCGNTQLSLRHRRGGRFQKPWRRKVYY